jgi:hypothetical protein
VQQSSVSFLTDSGQTSPQSPPEKKKLYGMLALKQIQRAAQLAEEVVPLSFVIRFKLTILGCDYRG